MTQSNSQGPSVVIGPVASDMSAFERAKIGVERLKAWLTAASIVASVAAAIVAYSSAQGVQRQEAADAFQLKVAEIVMASRTPWEAKGKATALAGFFPQRVPTSMGASFDPEKYGWGRESRRELLALLAAHAASPAEQAAVLKTWKALFPGDIWAKDIAP